MLAGSDIRAANDLKSTLDCVPVAAIKVLIGYEQHASPLAPSTATSCRLSATRIVRRLGVMRLDKITARDILVYQNRERARGLSEAACGRS